MPSLRFLAIWLVLAAASDLAGAATVPGAQLPDDRQKSVSAARVARPPVLDGRLNDEAWRHAQLDGRFTQNFPDAGRPPSEKTELYIVYDDRALYLGLRCHDTHPAQTPEWLTRRDRETNADKITIDIDSRNDHVSAYHFDVNVSGVLADGLRFNDTDYTSDWDGLWNAVTRRDSEGWSVEVQIPWRTLRFTAGTKNMGFQVRRHLPRRQEVDAWAFIPRNISGEVSRYGHLLSRGDLGPARLVQIAPYVSASLAMRSGEGSGDRVRATPNAGADLKVGLTSGLTLDATLNPDFGQVEADQAQLNLSTFELFYPEKRPFFLEGVDLFATPLQQFYTRRVGRAPPDPALQDGEEVVETPATGRIWGALKLTGRWRRIYRSPCSMPCRRARRPSCAAPMARSTGAASPTRSPTMPCCACAAISATPTSGSPARRSTVSNSGATVPPAAGRGARAMRTRLGPTHVS